MLITTLAVCAKAVICPEYIGTNNVTLFFDSTNSYYLSLQNVSY